MNNRKKSVIENRRNPSSQKTSNKNSYGYNENISEILKKLSFNTNNLFKFVCRQKFIDYNLPKLETVFPLFDQEKKEKMNAK